MRHTNLCPSVRHARPARRILAATSPLPGRRGDAAFRRAASPPPCLAVTTDMSRATTEPHPVPTFPSTLPTCAVCSAFLDPDEREANLLVTSMLLAMRWPLRIRLLCLRCVD